MSGYTKTTIGGADFDLLCTGTVQDYSANPANLATAKKLSHIKRKLKRKLEDTIQALQIESGRTIAKIYIGKTYILQKKKRGGGRGYETFDPLDHSTWKKTGISSRWQFHKDEDYGRDGLVVLGAITRETMPERCRESGQVDQEDLALAMEQRLLHHYRLSHPDPRVVNKTFDTGKTTRQHCIAYAVYMAFRYEDTDETSSEDLAVETSTFPFSLREASDPRSPSPIDHPIQSGPSTSSPQRQQVTPPRSILKRTTQQAREDNTPLPSPTGIQHTAPATPSRPTPSPPPRKRLKLTSPCRDSTTSPSPVRSILKPTTPFSSTRDYTPLPPPSCKKQLSLTKRRSPSSTSTPTSTPRNKRSSPNTQRSPTNKRQQAGIGSLNATGSTPLVRKQLSLSTKQKRLSKSLEQRSTCSPSNDADEISQPCYKTRSPQAREGLQLSSLPANEQKTLELSCTPLKSPTKSPCSNHTPLSRSQMSTPKNPTTTNKDSNDTNIDNTESDFTPSIQRLSSFEQNKQDLNEDLDFQNQSDSQKCHQSYIMQKYLASLPEPVVTNSDVIDLTKED